MNREFISLDGHAPSPLWVRVHGTKPPDWQERVLAYSCSEGAREQLNELQHAGGPDDERRRYLVGALTELRKLGLALERWLDGLDALGEDEADALWCRGLADEQAIRQRQAWELLLELIGFGITDTHAHWAHHAALLELQQRAANLADASAFFSCRPASVEANVLDAARAVVARELALGDSLARCWYASRRTPAHAEAVARSGLRGLASQRKRLQELLISATPTERVALGVSYERLYSRLSRRVHFSVGRSPSPEDADAARGHGDGSIEIADLRWGVAVVARLGSLCLARLQALTGLNGGAVCRLHHEAREGQRVDPHEDMLHAIAVGGVRVGAFAIVDERLSEVRARETNQLGHARYLVAYVSERPHPDIEEEWRPAPDVLTLWERQKPQGWLDEWLALANPDERRAMLDLDADRRLRSFVRAAWDQSLRNEVLARLRDAPPASYS